MLVEGSAGSMTFTVAWTTPSDSTGTLPAFHRTRPSRTPCLRPRDSHQPPPARIKFCSAVSCAVLVSTSPVVLRKMTARYWRDWHQRKRSGFPLHPRQNHWSSQALEWRRSVSDGRMPKSRRRGKDEDLIGRLTSRRERENRNQECSQDLNHSITVLLYCSQSKSPGQENL